MIKKAGLALLLLLAAGCSDDADKDPFPGTTRIHMGGTFSRNGVSAVATWNNAFALAADDVSWGLKNADYPTGRRLSFDQEARDTKNDVAITVAGATELVRDKGVKLLINGTSSDTVALGKLDYDDDPENDLDVPIACVACSSPALHNPTATNADLAVQGADRNSEQWIFGLAMSSVPQSTVLWGILKDKTPEGNLPGDLNGDGTVKISTIALDDAFGIGFQDAMERVVKAAAPEAIFEKTKHPKDANVNQYDWPSALATLTDDQTEGETDAVPDVLVEFTFPQFSLALVKAYDEDILFLHTHSMRERPVVLSAENKLEKHEGTSYLPSDGESGRIFDERFVDQEGVPRESQWDAHVYDSAFLFALGTVKATLDMENPEEVSGAEIRDAMLTLNEPDGEVVRVGPDEFGKAAQFIADGVAINYEGASGPCDFDDWGRALNRISHWRVENSQVKELAEYDCVASLDCPKVE